MRRLFPLLAALSLGFAPAPFLAQKPTSVEADLKALEGEWEQVSEAVDGGAPMPPPYPISDVFAGGRLATTHGGEVASRWRVTLSPTATPKAMDILGESPDNFHGLLIRLVYRIEGDMLTVCYRPNKPRPSGFEPGEGVRVVIYKRKKAKPRSPALN